MENKFEHNGFGKRLSSMLKVDFRRMFTMRTFYIIAGACFLMPILILTMTTMFGGEDSMAGTQPPSTSVTTQAEPMFENTWQIIGSFSGGAEQDTSADTNADPAAMGMSMDMTTMCNINMLYFGMAVLVCLFVSEDFKSGYSKNLFTVRAKKSDYVISKTLVCFVGSAFMLISFFVGAMLGGAIAGLPFDLGTASIGSIVMCMLSKIFLSLVFVAIFLAVSVAAKERTWLSMIGSFAVGMLLFMMIPMLTPLDATSVNVIMCLVGGAVFAVGLGAVSGVILNKTRLV
ncbi:MAG: ABC transporter permease [Oscillospiraceae bacterium]|nr:ABC transporter permease [Oscillospiraceae bacterium]